jgi:hypothetical protein
MHLATLEKKKGKFSARLIEDAELEEHKQNIEAAKDSLREFRESQRVPPPDIPDVPKPD